MISQKKITFFPYMYFETMLAEPQHSGLPAERCSSLGVDLLDSPVSLGPTDAIPGKRNYMGMFMRVAQDQCQLEIIQKPMVLRSHTCESS